MTAPRSARSAWLLVGSTPGWRGDVPRAGPGLRRVRARPRAGHGGAAECAFGVVVGRLDAGVAGERPECGPGLEEVAGDAAAVLVARALAGVAAHDRLELGLGLADHGLEPGAGVGVLEDFPGPKQPLADPQAVFAELALCGHAFGVRLEVTGEVRPAELAACERQVGVGPTS